MAAKKSQAQQNQPETQKISEQDLQALILDRNRLSFLDTCLAHAGLNKKLQPGFQINFKDGVFRNINYSSGSNLNIRGAIDVAMRDNLTNVSVPFMTPEQLENALKDIERSLESQKTNEQILQNRRDEYKKQLAVAKKSRTRPKNPAKPKAKTWTRKKR